MNFEEREMFIRELQRFSVHRSLEIAKSNIDRLGLFLDLKIKTGEIRKLTAQNIIYSLNNNEIME